MVVEMQMMEQELQMEDMVAVQLEEPQQINMAIVFRVKGVHKQE